VYFIFRSSKTALYCLQHATAISGQIGACTLA